MGLCENCGIEHEKAYGSGRFCTQSCAKSFSSREKRLEINAKVSKKLKEKNKNKNPLIEKKCEYCKKEFSVKGKKIKQTTCSKSCSAKLKWTDMDYRKSMSINSSINAHKLHARLDVKFGWRKRTKFKMSYPEKIAKSILEKNKIKYEYEYPFHPYFIDFAIIEYKIAIEIDGKQHNLPERVISDSKKDLKLVENGWTVYRIKWPSDNIIDKINQILASIPSP